MHHINLPMVGFTRSTLKPQAQMIIRQSGGIPILPISRCISLPPIPDIYQGACGEKSVIYGDNIGQFYQKTPANL